MAVADKLHISPGPLVAAMPWATPNEMSFGPRDEVSEWRGARVLLAVERILVADLSRDDQHVPGL